MAITGSDVLIWLSSKFPEQIFNGEQMAISSELSRNYWATRMRARRSWVRMLTRGTQRSTFSQ